MIEADDGQPDKHVERPSVRAYCNARQSSGNLPRLECQGPSNSDDIYGRLPSKPLWSFRKNGGKGLILEHYRHPPSAISSPGLVNAVIVVHLSGPVSIEERADDGAWRRRWADKHHISLSPPGQPIARRFQAPTEVFLLQVTQHEIKETVGEISEEDPDKVALLPRFAEMDVTLDKYCRALAEEFRQPPIIGRDLTLQLLSRAVIVSIIQRHSSLGIPAEKEPLTIAPLRLRAVIDHMHDAAESEQHLGKLAALAGLSPSHFSRAFRATVGVPPHRYLCEIRMRRARQLLEEGQLSILEIALCSGFEHASSFSTAFLRSTGVTPRTWRLERCK